MKTCNVNMNLIDDLIADLEAYKLKNTSGVIPLEESSEIITLLNDHKMIIRTWFYL